MARAAVEVAKQFIEFANETGSPYHSVAASVKLLRASGFQEIQDGNAWTLAKGGKYFVTKDGSDVMAFVVGGNFNAAEQSGFSIVGAHTDSPCLRLRPNSRVSGSGMLQVGMQTYGGGLWHTWFDRPLGLAGKVVVREGGEESKKLVEKLVRINRPIMMIPNLAVHLQTADERKAFSINPETHLQPVICSQLFDEEASGGRGDASKSAASARHHEVVLEAVAVELGCQPADIVDADLCLMDAQPANLVGVYEEFISSPRIDNLMSTWAAIQGLCDHATSEQAKTAQDIAVAVSFDHEECGSQSAVGADGDTFPTWLERILGGLQVSQNDRPAVFSKSFLLSADCAHGVHPNYAGKHQSEHRPEFHKGIVIKTNANQRYATTTMTAALLREVCKRAGVLVQDFVVRNDSPCGSTIGPIISSKTGVRTIDIGIPQWAMHSCRESCASSDAGHLLGLCRAFFATFREIDSESVKV